MILLRYNNYFNNMKTKEELRIYKRNWARKKNGITEESLKESATHKGRKAELFALNILKGSKDMNDEVMNRPYDIEWNNKKIDVKSCNLYKRKLKRGKKVNNCGGWWTFNKNKGYADEYFCMCLIDDRPVKIYLIPNKAFSNGITIGKKSNKFDKYLIKKYV